MSKDIDSVFVPTLEVLLFVLPYAHTLAEDRFTCFACKYTVFRIATQTLLKEKIRPKKKNL